VFFFIWLTLSKEMPMDARRCKLSTTPSGVRAMLPVELRRPPEMEERTLPKDERALMLSSSISVSERSGVYIAAGEDGRVVGGSKSRARNSTKMVGKQRNFNTIASAFCDMTASRGVALSSRGSANASDFLPQQKRAARPRWPRSSSSARAERLRMQSLAVLCPCMPIPGSVDKQPIRDDTSDRDGEEGPPSLALKAKGWLGKLAAPITAMKDDYDKERAREAKLEELKAGATMVLQADGSTLKAGTMVKIAVSSDGTMVTWTASGVSGVMAMSAIREVKPVMSSTFFSKPAPIPKQFKLIADDQIVSFEAKDDDVKAQWMSTLEECAAAAAEAKVGRKMMQQAKRRMGLDERKREAERRKAEVMKSVGSGGMKHTAAAMMSRA